VGNGRGSLMEYNLETIAKIWPTIYPVFSVPRTKADYNRLVEFLDNLIDRVGEDESHPLASLAETVGTLIETYEDRTTPEKKGDPVEVLSFLMSEHGLKQTDLPEIGSQGVVSEVLSGKRKLNLRQIKLLARRFNVSPEVFIGTF
jgi:HTH-type transcriptional regulator / antitoxin HigA